MSSENMSADNPYLLPESRARKVFEEDIVPEELSHLTGHVEDGVRPVAVIVLGQPGAGKTGSCDRIKEAMQSIGRQPAHIVGDTYKPYHPAYARLLVEDPAQASPATSPDARRWIAMATDYVIERRIDVLLESAGRDRADFADLAQRFHDAEYRVEVAVMGVPEGLSRLGIRNRYHDHPPEAGPGRLTARATHDVSYAGILEAAAFIDDSDVVDQVAVLRRGNLVGYANERVNRRWRWDPATVAAIEAERRRPLTSREAAAAREGIQRLRDRGLPALDAELIEITQLLRPLVDTDALAGSSRDPLVAPLVPLSLPGDARSPLRQAAALARSAPFPAETALNLGEAESPASPDYRTSDPNHRRGR